MIPILYEDDDILVINKQSGLAVQGGEGISHSVDELLSQQMNQKIYLVHRLDRDTAGILVTAKNKKAASLYTNIFSDKTKNKICKKYTAFCIGNPTSESGKILDSIEKKGVEKSAATYFRVDKKGVIKIQDENYICSWFSLELGTGRMHQIRIHMKNNGTPIIADDKYGDFKLNKLLKKEFHIQKLQLAATYLEIPVQGKIKSIEIPLPEHMQTVENLFFADL